MLPYSALLFSVLTLASAGPLSAQDVIKPGSTTDRLPKPASISAAQQPDGRIRVVWSAVDGALRYKVYRSVPPNGTKALTLPNPSDTQYVDTDVKAGSTYYYLVDAVNEAGIEGMKAGSAPVTATAVVPPADTTPATPAQAPVAPPTDVVVTLFDYLRPKVTWQTSVPGARFVIERREDDGANPTAVTWQPAVKLSDKSWPCDPTCTFVEDPRPMKRNTWSEYRITAVEPAPSTRQSEPVTTNRILVSIVPTVPTEIHEIWMDKGQGGQLAFRPDQTGLQYVSLDSNTVSIWSPGVVRAQNSGSTYVTAFGLDSPYTGFKLWIWFIHVR